QSSCGKDAYRQSWSRTSETARHQGLLCDCFVAYIRDACLVLLHRRCGARESSGIKANSRVGEGEIGRVNCFAAATFDNFRFADNPETGRLARRWPNIGSLTMSGGSVTPNTRLR